MIMIMESATNDNEWEQPQWVAPHKNESYHQTPSTESVDSNSM